MRDLYAAIRVAFRHIDDGDTTEQERESILATIVQHFPSAEAETASRALHHLHEQRKHQLTLKNILDGSGSKSATDGNGRDCE